ncbi:hypothetical protein GGR51DRAFT_526786 [Nemania sp. FL0031]|nr:hypothetical protein GGR51DRAFT_526786 [Nemania sp. FL0031]
MRATTRNRNIGVAYLYCVHSDKTQSAKNFLKAILHQLAQQSQELSDELKTLYINHNAPSPPTSPKFDEYEAVLESEVQRFEEVYLVVDAIDECRADDENEDQPNNIRSKLLDTFRYLGDKISLLVTSRERSLNSEERDRTPSFASMEVIATDKEIKLYVEKYIKVKPETSLVRLTKKPEVMDRIQEAVAIRAAGMFLPAKLYVDHIAAIASRPSRYKLSGVMAALQKLPYFQEVKELRQSYQQAYANILKGLWDEKDDDDIELARAIFSWASCCRDPLDLTIDMVKRAWYLEKEQGTEEPRNEDFSTDSDYDEVLEDKKLEDRILSVCRGLIVIDQQSRNIRFVHYTAEEYFSDPDVRQKHLPGAQEEIARSCIKCILSQGSDRNGAGHVQLYRYASLHWGHHARVEEAALKSELHDVFFLRPNHIHESFRAVVDSIAPRGIDPYSQYGAHETIEPLHIAAYFGLRSTTIALLEARANIESKDSRGWTTMRWAIIGRSLELVKLLFDRKADMFSKDNTGDLTIFWAVSSHRRDLHFGSIITDINCQATFGDIRMVGSSESFTTALDRHTAAITSQPIIEFLLKELAHNTLEVRDKLGRTLLSAVAANWQWEAVEILCNRHADINAKDTSGMTPLLSALRPACSRIIHDLSLNGKSAIRIGDVIKVKPGTELNIGDSDYAERMIEPHIGRLIGDDLESRNENGRTALSLAAQWGFHSVVRSLLEKGADPKTTDIHKMTPLHWACSLPGFNTAIRNLKCEGEVRVHLKATELQIRVSKLKRFTGGPIERSVEQLLRYGADTGALNNFAETALDLALSVGLQSHARMLNEYEAMTRKGLSRCSQASASFWAPNTMQIQDYGHKLLALIGQGSRFAIKNLLVSDNVSLQIDSTSTISNLLTDGMSHVIIENEPRILNWRASGKSSIDISALPEQREKLRSDEPLATSQPHGETNGARIDVDVVVARIGRFGQARIVNLSLDGESHLRVGADAIVGRMKVSGRSQVWTRGQSSISYLRVTGSARLTVQGESNVTAIEVSGCGKVYTQGRCTVSRITTKGQARLGVRAAAQISAMRVIEASKVWTTGKTATLAVEVANRARLRVGGESTIDRMVVSHFSQVDIRNASRIRKLLVEQKSFVVLQAEAKVDDILAKHSSLVITTGCSEILTLHACSKARVFILNSYRQQPIKCLVEHKARLLYRGKLLDNEGEPSPHFDVRDSAQASQLEVDDSQPITEVMKKLRIHPLAKRQGEDHVEDNLDDIMVMEETGLLRWEGEEEGENEDDDGYEADDGYEVDDGHEVDDGYGGDGGYEDDGGY